MEALEVPEAAKEASASTSMISELIVEQLATMRQRVTGRGMDMMMITRKITTLKMSLTLTSVMMTKNRSRPYHMAYKMFKSRNRSSRIYTMAPLTWTGTKTDSIMISVMRKHG